MVDIFDEVSDDLRSERALVLLRRFGGLAAGLAVLILVIVAVQQVYTWHEGQRRDAAGAAFIKIGQAIDAAGPAISNDQRAADAKELTDFAANAPAGYAALARLRAAALDADAGNLDAASALWDSVAQDGDGDPIFRDLANLLWAQHEAGRAPDAAVLSRIAPLEADGNALHGLAREVQALIYLHEGKTDEAKGLFSQIAGDPAAPDGVRNRADGLLAKLNAPN